MVIEENRKLDTIINLIHNNDKEELINILANRIEDLERTLHDDEDFCNQDIDAIYQTACKYIEQVKEKLQEQLNRIGNELNEFRKENINLSKINRKQFDDEIDDVNQLFSIGKHQEALEKFRNYEKYFLLRKTVLFNLPKLHMKDININEWISLTRANENINQSIKISSNEEQIIERSVIHDETILNEESRDMQFDRQLNSIKNYSTHKCICNSSSQETSTSPLDILPQQKYFSRRLNSQNFSASLQNQASNSEIDINNRLHIPRAVSVPVFNQTSTGTCVKTEPFASTLVCHREYGPTTSLLMISNERHLILFECKTDSMNRSTFSIIDRFYPAQETILTDKYLVLSMDFINETTFYAFTERNFIEYSLEAFPIIDSRTIMSNQTNNDEYFHFPNSVSTLYNNTIYHVYFNIESNWILSIYNIYKSNCPNDINLTEIYPDITCFIYICVNDNMINFLVEMDGSHYAVLLCSIKNLSKLDLKGSIQLVYAVKPLSICSIYSEHLKKTILFVNDPAAKIIHLLTEEKYLKSCQLTAYALFYVEKSKELLYASNDGIRSINQDEQNNFFSRLH